MIIIDEEAACSTEISREPVNHPPPRQLKVIQKETGGMQPANTLRVLAKISLVLAGVIFFCQVNAIACFKIWLILDTEPIQENPHDEHSLNIIKMMVFLFINH